MRLASYVHGGETRLGVVDGPGDQRVEARLEVGERWLGAREALGDLLQLGQPLGGGAEVGQGVGALHVTPAPCPHCHGSGAVKSARGHMVFSKPCLHCGGSGQQRQTRCPACGGDQVQVRTETMTINVPAGLADGARIRIPGKGNAGRNGGEPGDLYIDVSVQPHPVFVRDGDDLHVTVPLAVHEAALGAKIDVPSLDGPARVRVPPGTQSGQRFRVRERGVASPRPKRRSRGVIERSKGVTGRAIL